MPAHLQIDDPKERWLVATADAILTLATLPGRLLGRSTGQSPERILVFRLERVGDLIMARPGLRALRRQYPAAHIELAVGSWNAPLARLIPDVDLVTTLDLPWIARGAPASSFGAMGTNVRRWRAQGIDLGVNFEGDIRSHLLLYATGARARAGFDQAGGGPLLTKRLGYDPRRHVAWNILVLVAALGGSVPREEDLRLPPMALPDDAVSRATDALAARGEWPRLIGVHPSGGRLVKQWPPESFAEAAAALARRHRAALVVTGSATDRAVADAFLSALPSDTPCIDLTGTLDLVQLAAVLQRVDLFLGCDSGPMHLAAAVGTPVVAVFGPSDPHRWGPLGAHVEVVRAGLPCSPCNRIRKPPERCVGRIPECLEAVGPELVVSAAERLLAAASTEGARAAVR